MMMMMLLPILWHDCLLMIVVLVAVMVAVVGLSMDNIVNNSVNYNQYILVHQNNDKNHYYLDGDGMIDDKRAHACRESFQHHHHQFQIHMDYMMLYGDDDADDKVRMVPTLYRQVAMTTISLSDDDDDDVNKLVHPIHMDEDDENDRMDQNSYRHLMDQSHSVSFVAQFPLMIVNSCSRFLVNG